MTPSDSLRAGALGLATLLVSATGIAQDSSVPAEAAPVTERATPAEAGPVEAGPAAEPAAAEPAAAAEAAPEAVATSQPEAPAATAPAAAAATVPAAAPAETPAPATEAPATETSPAAGDSETTPSPATDERRPFDGKHFFVGGYIGYGFTLSRVQAMDIQPQQLSAGGRLGYTFHFGLHLGAYFSMFQGSAIPQDYQVTLRDPIPLTATSSMWQAGLVIAYDHDLRYVILRYGLEIGWSSMDYDLGDIPFLAVGGYKPIKGNQGGVHFAPAFGAYVPFWYLYAGPTVRFTTEFNGQIPPSANLYFELGARF